MSRFKSAEDWLEWAQAKYDAAQERYAWSERADSSTMDSYSELASVIEAGIAARAAGRQPAQDRNADAQRALKLADQMETLGKGGFAFDAQAMADAARVIRRALA